MAWNGISIIRKEVKEMSKRKEQQLASKLTPQQQFVARMIVNNEWGELGPNGKKLTYDELVKLDGMPSRMTVFNWKKDPDFIAYMNYLSTTDLEGLQSEVNAAIMKLIRGGANGTPSVKALELYMKRFALLTERQLIETQDVDRRTGMTQEEIDRTLNELDRLLQ
jgi:hypothetical protein